ncbi:MAG: pyridoxal phosphate-dependent aminotransferase [Candidatus Aenigmatarchaeota archaeon]
MTAPAAVSVSSRIAGISESPTLFLNAKVGELKKSGIEVINFTVGEPDFPTPENVRKAAARAMEEGMTKYTPTAGTPELRRAIAGKLSRENGLEYSEKNVIATAGGKQALYNAIMTICNPGDEVIIPSPYWVTYPEQVKLAGAVPVFAKTAKEAGFRLKAEDVERRVTKKTRLLIVNSPNNPTGAVCKEAELQKLAELAAEKGFFVISDEIYEHLTYGERHVSIASLGDGIKERTITINGAAKAYSMTGWRIGFAAGPESLIKGMEKLQSHTTSNASSISQAAYLEALTGSQDSVKKMAFEFRKRRDAMVKGLNSIDGIECALPGGAFYAFPDVSGCFGKKVGNSAEFAAGLLQEARVAVVPGIDFGCEGHVRMSYACSMETIEKGIETLKGFVGSL